MKIYFGRYPEELNNVVMIDEIFLPFLKSANYFMEVAAEVFVAELLAKSEFLSNEVIAYTMNPLIINYFTDEFAKEYMWFVDETGNHIKVSDDESMLVKFEWGSVGEIMADDYRVLSDK